MGDLTPFVGVGPWQLAALSLAYAVAFLFKGVFGYGAVPPMVLAGSLLLGPHHAVLLAGLVNLATQGLLVPDGWRHGDRGFALRAIFYILPALVVGVLVFQGLPGDGLQVTVGVMLFLVLLFDDSSLKSRLLPNIDRNRGIWGAVSASVAGLMAGIIGAGAMVFFSVYLKTLISDRKMFRGTIILLVTGILVFRTVLFLGAGLITSVLIAETVIMIPVAAVALWVGGRLASRMSNAVYFRTYKRFMLAASALLVVRGLA